MIVIFRGSFLTVRSLLLIAICLCGVAGRALGQGPALPFPDTRYYRSVSAGPHSEVSTANGELSTSIPIVHLKGLGNTSIDVDVLFRSNSVAGTSYGAANNQPGAGWYLSTFRAMTNLNVAYDNTFAETEGIDQVNWWSAVYNANNTYTCTASPGTRETLVTNTNASGNITSYIVTDEKTLNTYTYGFNPATSGALTGVMWFSKITDIYGNMVNYGYTLEPSDQAYRLNTISDSSGRTVTFNYASTSPYVLSTIVLTAGGNTRTWGFDYGSGNGTLLLGWIYPPNVNGQTRRRRPPDQ